MVSLSDSSQWIDSLVGVISLDQVNLQGAPGMNQLSSLSGNINITPNAYQLENISGKFQQSNFSGEFLVEGTLFEKADPNKHDFRLQLTSTTYQTEEN